MTSRRIPELSYSETVAGSDNDLAGIAALVAGRTTHRRKRLDEQKLESLKDHLSWIASELLICRQQQQTSPSAKDLQRQLTRLARLAAEVDGAIRELPMFIRSLLNSAYHGQMGWNKTTNAPAVLDLGTVPPELAALAISAAAKHLVDFEQDGRVLGVIPSDRPGPQRAFQRQIDDPRIFLADQIAQLVAREQGPAKVTADEGGPVYNIVACLWEYATGLEAEGADLRKYIRRGVRAVHFMIRRQAVLDAKRALLEDRQKNSAKYSDPQAIADFNCRMLILDAQASRLASQTHAARWGYKPKAGPESGTA